ncbi:MAG: hypothetical protein MRY32_02730 [Rickettsiales bacterium]|nr:hypothetical protein [Rickettsiales bacterium]
MTETYKAINSNAELQTAITDLFGEDAGWVKEYFDSGSIGMLGGTFAGDDRKAFADGMTTIIRGLLKPGVGGDQTLRIKQGRDPIDSFIFASFLSDGRVDVEEFRKLTTRYDLGPMKLKERMGDELYAKFEALSIGVLNGIADKDPNSRTNTYSRPEFSQIFSRGYISHAYKPLFGDAVQFEAAIGDMNAICSSTPQADMKDALPITDALKKAGEGIAR